VNHHKTFSLSLQKKFEKRNLGLDFEVNKAFNELKIKSLLHRCHIVKQKGYATAALLYMVILLPFLKKYLTYFWSAKCFSKQIDAQKDTYYRFLNCERFNWRKFFYFLALRVIATCDEAPLSEKILIADDTIASKSGKDIIMGPIFSLLTWLFILQIGVPTIGYEILIKGPMDGFVEKRPSARKQMY